MKKLENLLLKKLLVFLMHEKVFFYWSNVKEGIRGYYFYKIVIFTIITKSFLLKYFTCILMSISVNI